jgi:hypothetical protein
MFRRLWRDYQLWRNHRIRVSSIVLKSNDEIVRKLDDMKAKFLEAERKEDKDGTLFYKGIYQILEWLIDESKQP